MEVRVRERLIGALVLVAIVVLFVPAILKGRGTAPAEPPVEATRRVEMPTSDAPAPPEESVLVPEASTDAAPATSPKPAEAMPPTSQPAAQSARTPGPQPAQPAARAPDAPPASPKTQAAAPAAAPPSPPAPASSSTATAWAVQLGAFSNRAKAEQLVAQLKERRYAAFVLEYRASGQVLYRVRVGPEQERARAEEIAARLAKDGFQPVVARHP
ncbi:MAG TPA: SPOR domain-containing protein [Steroidobacteraceae bacterium]|jgi:DedD protein|nr:SPOR domain-containing protein [Steroidobacteraceae bacterium]